MAAGRQPCAPAAALGRGTESNAPPPLGFEISGVFTAWREESWELQSPAIRAVPPQEGASLEDLLFPHPLWWEGIEITANGLL